MTASRFIIAVGFLIAVALGSSSARMQLRKRASINRAITNRTNDHPRIVLERHSKSMPHSSQRSPAVTALNDDIFPGASSMGRNKAHAVPLSSRSSSDEDARGGVVDSHKAYWAAAAKAVAQGASMRTDPRLTAIASHPIRDGTPGNWHKSLDPPWLP